MNNLRIDLEGKVVVLSAEYYTGDEKARRFLCRSGFGCSAFTRGLAIFGTFLIDGKKYRVDGEEVEKLSEDQSQEIGGAGGEVKN